MKNPGLVIADRAAEKEKECCANKRIEDYAARKTASQRQRGRISRFALFIISCACWFNPSLLRAGADAEYIQFGLRAHVRFAIHHSWDTELYGRSQRVTRGVGAAGVELGMQVGGSIGVQHGGIHSLLVIDDFRTLHCPNDAFLGAICSDEPRRTG